MRAAITMGITLMSKIDFELASTLGTSEDGRRTGTEKRGEVVPKVDFDPSNTLGVSCDGRKIGAEKRGVLPKTPLS